MKLPIGTYSFLNSYENCAYKAYRLYVVRDIPYVETPERKWGNEVHSAMDDAISKGAPLPETMQAAQPLCTTFHGFKQQGVKVATEYKLAMDAEGKPIDYWHKDKDKIWFRGVLDVACRPYGGTSAWVCDWKTGKPREEPLELETGALLLKVHHPELTHIVGEFFWLKDGKAGVRYHLNDHARTFGKLQNWRTELEQRAASGVWPKTKNPLCGYCDVYDCEFNRKKR